MIENAFAGKATPPSPKQLAQKLGPTKDLWNQLVKEISSECGITEKEWNSYSPKAGWSLRLKHKKRNIVYLVPCDGCFRVAFILGDRAIKVAKAAEFPTKFTKLIAEAPRYPEGSAIRFEVTTPDDLEIVRRLAKIKLGN